MRPGLLVRRGLRGRWRVLIALALAAAAVAPGRAVQVSVPDHDVRPKKVLALHIVRRDSPVYDDAFRIALTDGLDGRLDYYSEYIDLNRLTDEKYRSALRTYIRTRYVEDSVDLVIASGPSVVDFLNSDPSLLHDIPVVYTTRPGVQGGPNSTGVVSVSDMAGTLKVALEMLPATRDVYVVSGASRFDRVYAQLFMEQRAAFSTQVTFHDLAALPLPETLRRVATLPPRSIAFFVSLADDGAGRLFMPLDAVEQVAAVANAPVFSWHETTLGLGIIGGRLHSSIHAARETARLALRVLAGEPPESIPPETIDAFSYQFDGRQLRKWNVDESRLPAGSFILFREPSLLDQYRGYLVAGGLVFVAQLGLISGLLIQRARRRRAESALRLSESRNTAILRAFPDLMFVLDRKSTIVDYHARDRSLLFAPPEAFLGKTIREVLPPPLAETLATSLEQAYQTREQVVVEYDLPLEELRHFECRLVPVDDTRALSIIRDVTEAKRAHELNRVLAGRLIVSQEEERQRIARDLHDDLSQKIALLNIEVDQIAEDVADRKHRLRLLGISSQVGEIATDLSDLSHELHPSRLHTLGLVESIRSLCYDISQQRGLKVEFTQTNLPRSVDPVVSLCLYRITQEALHNVAKHSQATAASVALVLDGSDIHLRITDSGVGFDPHLTEHAGLGLVSMRERVGVLKGHIVIDAAPGRGTCIAVRLPLSPVVRDALPVA